MPVSAAGPSAHRCPVNSCRFASCLLDLGFRFLLRLVPPDLLDNVGGTPGPSAGRELVKAAEAVL